MLLTNTSRINLVEKCWRDSKIGSIYEGTWDMQLQTIAKLITGPK